MAHACRLLSRPNRRRPGKRSFSVDLSRPRGFCSSGRGRRNAPTLRRTACLYYTLPAYKMQACGRICAIGDAKRNCVETEKKPVVKGGKCPKNWEA